MEADRIELLTRIVSLEGNMKKQTILTILTALLFLIPAGPAEAKTPAEKEISIGDSGYFVSIPAEWKAVPQDGGGSMKVDILVKPSGLRQDHLSVHVMDRNGAGLDRWFEYHLEENNPAVHGRHEIVSREEIAVGPRKARLVHALELENHIGYGLIDIMFFTEHHVIVLSYLYDSERGHFDPRVELEKAAASFRSAVESAPPTAGPEKTGRTRGFTLGLEERGLFLSLPEGWVPDRKHLDGDEVIVKLPRGLLRVITFAKIRSSKNHIRNQGPGFRPHEEDRLSTAKASPPISSFKRAGKRRTAPSRKPSSASTERTVIC